MHVLAAGELSASKYQQLVAIWKSAHFPKSMARRCCAAGARHAQVSLRSTSAGPPLRARCRCSSPIADESGTAAVALHVR